MVTQDEAKDETAILYKTKVVQFLGRSVPIILQNDNGPCPLLAICNVLLLRNNINLNLDITEISLQRLLSLVAERLLDANSNTENKNEEYVRNQQQNIADAIELLPRLATGLDVNVRFRNIHDFEFTPECAVFDLLDIGLMHGWLYDPQDGVTSKIIGSNSYNTLVEKLVDLQSKRSQGPVAESSEEDFVDFVAATTAALGVPSPSLEILARTKSMEDSEMTKQLEKSARKGDEEEAAQLQEALELSKDKALSAPNAICPLSHCDTKEKINLQDTFSKMEVPNLLESSSNDVDQVLPDEVKKLTMSQASDFMNASNFLIPLSDDPGGVNLSGTQGLSDEKVVELKGINEQCSSSCGETINKSINPPVSTNSITVCTEQPECNDLQIRENELPLNDIPAATEVCKLDESSPPSCNLHVYDEELIAYPSECETESLGLETPLFPKNCVVTCEEIRVALMEHENREKEVIELDREVLSLENEDVSYLNDIDDTGSSSLHSSEPLYEGEAVLVEAETSAFESREPLYEGEVVLAEHPDARERTENKISSLQFSDGELKSEIQEEHLSVAVTEGIVVENFLNSNASQLTYYGLFCLQEELKERELCVFFRNNHFSTMFKYNGDLYLLVTDQGYLNQPDIVWEKLHEVHGDSVFVTGNFSVFQADQSSTIWNEQDAVAATADYLSSQERSDTGSQQVVSEMNYQSDLQLAMALQQQEFEQRKRQQQQQQQPQQQSHASSHSLRGPGRTEAAHLVRGPKSSSIQPKQETKTKEKCVIM